MFSSGVKVSVRDIDTGKIGVFDVSDFESEIGEWFKDARPLVRKAFNRLVHLLSSSTWDIEFEFLAYYLGLEIDCLENSNSCLPDR